MAEHKFKVGDWVIAHLSKDSPYAETADGWIGEVVKIEENGRFKAEGRRGFSAARFTYLEEKYFDLYEGQRDLPVLKVGDAVVAHEYTPYGTTTRGWKGEIIKIRSDGHFDVKGKGDTMPECTFEDKEPRYFDLVKKPFYDPKYFASGNVKEIESVADAMLIILASRACGKCDKCLIRMFEKDKGASCSAVQEKAKNYIAKAIGAKWSDFRETKPDVVEKMYSLFSGGGIPEPLPAPKKEKASKKTEKAEPKPGTCKKCKKCRKIGGIPFCYAWHNWTVENGSCFMFEDKTGKIKKEMTPEESLLSGITITVENSSVSEIEIPF